MLRGKLGHGKRSLTHPKKSNLMHSISIGLNKKIGKCASLEAQLRCHLFEELTEAKLRQFKLKFELRNEIFCFLCHCVFTSCFVVEYGVCPCRIGINSFLCKGLKKALSDYHPGFFGVPRIFIFLLCALNYFYDHVHSNKQDKQKHN